jgi:hypothetical protein
MVVKKPCGEQISSPNDENSALPEQLIVLAIIYHRGVREVFCIDREPTKRYDRMEVSSARQMPKLGGK